MIKLHTLTPYTGTPCCRALGDLNDDIIFSNDPSIFLSTLHGKVDEFSAYVNLGRLHTECFDYHIRTQFTSAIEYRTLLSK